ncbi:MAG: hypothetical protein GXO35_09620 [Gammaproteobacteria bacterium]|nr:hypothetical protein [Gammaproteobacteria bacterium]
MNTPRHLKVTLALTMVSILSLGGVTGCSKDPVKLVSAQFVDNVDNGSGNFDRMLQICFSKPISSEYYHKVVLVTKENVKIAGGSLLRPLFSDPDNKCQLRNVYSYINKNSPLDARQLIKDYVVPGNVSQLLIQVYNEKPEGKERPIAEKLFKNL